MAVKTRVDWKAVATGAVVTIAVGIMASVVANVIDLDKDSSGWIVFFWIDVIGAGVGGYLAARNRLDTPLIHGALAGFAGYVVVAIIATAINLSAGHDAPTVVQVIFNALWLTVGGTLGGWVASWRGGAKQRRTSAS
jgi:putative membrane protein (TIGR04086 family)